MLYLKPFHAVKGKRMFVAKMLMHFGMFHILKLGKSKQLTVFNNHRLKIPGEETLYDDSAFGQTADLFRNQMKALKLDADPISETELIKSIEGKLKIPKHSFMVTFDDGYRDNYTLAYPILKELAISGLFFIPTDTIERRNLGWWDQIHYILKTTTKREFEFKGEKFQIQFPLQPLSNYFNDIMKKIPSEETANLLDELARTCAVSVPTRLMADSQLMTWDQLVEMDQNGMTIGSHSHSHRVMSTLSLRDQKQELLHSKTVLESKLKHLIYSFAYPVGGYEHFNVETKSLCKDVGYKLAFSFLTGVNLGKSLDPFDVKRLDQPVDFESLFGSLVVPSVFGRRTCEFEAPLIYGSNEIL